MCICVATLNYLIEWNSLYKFKLTSDFTIYTVIIGKYTYDACLSYILFSESVKKISDCFGRNNYVIYEIT